MNSFENLYSFDNLKEEARISKKALNNLIKKISLGVSYIKDTFSYEKCNSCPLKEKQNEELIMSYCRELCPHKATGEKTYESIDTYERKITSSNGSNELSMTYVVYRDTISPTKTAIHQYFLYNFFNTNKVKVLTNVRMSSIAKMLNVAPATIKRNNEVLQRANIIHSTYVGANYYNIKVDGLDELHLKGEEGGNGYLTITKKDLLHLLGINNINLLRVEIEKMLLADKAKGLGKEDEVRKLCNVNVISFKNVLPHYIIKGRKSVTELLNSDVSKFKVSNISFERDYIELDLSNYPSKKERKENLRKELTEKMNTFVKSNDIPLVLKKEIPTDSAVEDVNTDIYSDMPENLRKQLTANQAIEPTVDLVAEYDVKMKDLVQLSVEYGFGTICRALLYIKRRYIIGEGLKIENIGGFVRDYVVREISYRGSYLNIAV